MSWRRHIGVGATVAAVLAVLGAPLGLLWELLAPRPELLVVKRGTAVLASPESTAFMDADGWFAVLTVSVGLLAAVAAYPLTRRRHGTAVVLGLGLGGTVGALLTWTIGRALHLSAYQEALRGARVGDQVRAYLTLHAWGVIVLEALIAVAVFGLIEGVIMTSRDGSDESVSRVG